MKRKMKYLWVYCEILGHMRISKISFIVFLLFQTETINHNNIFSLFRLLLEPCTLLVKLKCHFNRNFAFVTFTVLRIRTWS